MRKTFLKSRTTAVVAGAAVLGMLVTGGAVAAGQINSSDIRNNSVKSVDIKNGTVQYRDLNRGVKKRIAAGNARLAVTNALLQETRRVLAGALTDITDLKRRVTALEDEADGGTLQPFTANGQSSVTANGPRLVLEPGNTTGTSVETTNLDRRVAVGDVLSFKYTLSGGATCTGGAPRFFIIVNGVNTNSWDDNFTAGTQCGTDGVVTFTANTAGSIGNAGFVYDNSVPGTVDISNVTVNGVAVTFP